MTNNIASKFTIGNVWDLNGTDAQEIIDACRNHLEEEEALNSLEFGSISSSEGFLSGKFHTYRVIKSKDRKEVIALYDLGKGVHIKGYN